MIIWSRWGIVALVIPVALILMAQALLKPVGVADPKPVKQAKPAAEGADASPTEEEIAEAEKLALVQKKKALERELAAVRATQTGYGVGCLLGAAVLWPLGRWMNRTEAGVAVDPQSGNLVDARIGGGHTMFFIPVEYWSFVWAGIGLYKFFGSA